MDELQLESMADIMRLHAGSVAALDQSGGSTGAALERAGVNPSVYGDDEAKMFDLMHEFRTRMMTDEAFLDHRVIAAILFVGSLTREVGGLPTVDYLREIGKVPFVKIDKGLEYIADGAQLMKNEAGIMADAETALKAGAFGTKMRSLISGNSYRYVGDELVPNFDGLNRVLDQQFKMAEAVRGLGLVPILEPELSIKARDKDMWEVELNKGAGERLTAASGEVILKLTPPERPDRYRELTLDPKVMRVVMLSGGLSLAEACDRVARNTNAIPSFSRALEEGLGATRSAQSDEEFHKKLDTNIAAMYAASGT